MTDGESGNVPAVQDDHTAPAPADPFPLKNLHAGAPDKRGQMVTELLWAVPDFKIYATAKGISPQFSDDPAIASKQRLNYLALGPELADTIQQINLLKSGWGRITSWVSKLFRLGDDPRLGYYEREIARAIAQALSDQLSESQTTLKALSAQISRRMSNVLRVLYFSICFIAALAITVSLSGYAVTLAAPATDEILGLNKMQLSIAAIMGSLGALLSAAIGLRNLSIDPMATLTVNITYAFQRMLVGVLGAIVLHITLKSGLVSNLLGSQAEAAPVAEASTTYKLAFMSLLAGFSERMVPNLLEKTSEKYAPAEQQNTSGKTTDATPGKAPQPA